MVLFVVDIKYIILTAAWLQILSKSPLMNLLLNHVLISNVPKLAENGYKFFLFMLDLVLPRIVGKKRSKTII